VATSLKYNFKTSPIAYGLTILPFLLLVAWLITATASLPVIAFHYYTIHINKVYGFTPKENSLQGNSAVEDKHNYFQAYDSS